MQGKEWILPSPSLALAKATCIVEGVHQPALINFNRLQIMLLHIRRSCSSSTRRSETPFGHPEKRRP